VAHEDILFHWDGSDCTGSNVSIGGVQGTLGSGNTGGVTSFPISEGIGNNEGYFDNESDAATYYLSFPLTPTQINFNEGCISLWVKFPSVVTGDYVLGIGESSNLIWLSIDAGLLTFRYTADSGSSTCDSNAAPTAGLWYFVKICWSQSLSLAWLEINGIVQTDTAAISYSWAGVTSATLYLGAGYSGVSNCDAHISGLTITNNPNTPDTWSVFGKPVYMPLIKKNGVYQQYGADMDAVITPGGNALVTKLGEVS